jgi:hypothetical protein
MNSGPTGPTMHGAGIRAITAMAARSMFQPRDFGDRLQFVTLRRMPRVPSSSEVLVDTGDIGARLADTIKMRFRKLNWNLAMVAVRPKPKPQPYQRQFAGEARCVGETIPPAGLRHAKRYCPQMHSRCHRHR